MEKIVCFIENSKNLFVVDVAFKTENNEVVEVGVWGDGSFN